MSARLTAAIWLAKLAPPVKLLALALAECADGGGRFGSKQQREAETLAGLRSGVTDAALMRLEALGWIRFEGKTAIIGPPQERPKSGRGAPIGPAVWEAYAAAFEARYGAPAVRNAQANALCRRLVELLGADDAPAVAAWYLTHPDALYVGSGHTLSLLVRDAAKIRTQWVKREARTRLHAIEEERMAVGQAAVDEAARILEHGP